MVQNTGIQVPDNKIACGENIKIPMIAEGAITPGMLVMKGTGDNQVVIATAGSKNVIGVADLNRHAVAVHGGAETDDYAVGDPLEVIVSGFVKVEADTHGITAGLKVGVGTHTSGHVENNQDTAVPAADTYNTVAMELCKDELGYIIGRAFTSAAAGSFAVIWLSP